MAVTINGPKGNLTLMLHPATAATVTEGAVVVTANEKVAHFGAMHGTMRTLVSNAIDGVTRGWEKKLELVGVGYRAAVLNNELVLTVGYSHPVKIPAPTGIAFTVIENTITVVGSDRQLVGETAAIIRRVRPPEPYKGKGIRYVGEHIRRKAGKAAKTAAPGAAK